MEGSQGTSIEQEQFALFRDLGFLQVLETEEGPTVVLIAKHFDWSLTRSMLPSLHKFVVNELEKVAQQPYQLLYINTGYSYWSNSPGIWWLWHTYRSLPHQFREQLQRCYVLHGDWAVRLAGCVLYPLLAGDLWQKVEFVPRVEFLPPGLQDAVDLPNFVTDHEQELSRHPLMDYGVAADAHEAPVPHLSGLRRQLDG